MYSVQSVDIYYQPSSALQTFPFVCQRPFMLASCSASTHQSHGTRLCAQRFCFNASVQCITICVAPQRKRIVVLRGRLTLLSSALSDLGGETGLDSGDGTAGATAVASNEQQTVFSFVEFGGWGTAGFAGYIFHCDVISIRSKEQIGRVRPY